VVATVRAALDVLDVLDVLGVPADRLHAEDFGMV
jgi:hypothetical protein